MGMILTDLRSLSVHQSFLLVSMVVLSFTVQVGDIRVKFQFAGLSGQPHPKLGGPDRVSIISKQSSGQLVSYQTQAGNVLELLYDGDKTKEESG